MVSDGALAGRCYCGSVRLHVTSEAEAVTYCHCVDCRRWTGAPAPAFAAYRAADLTQEPRVRPVSHLPGVRRWFCRDCGSALAAAFDYLPGQIYVPLGVLDRAADMRPTMHCHAGSALPWLHLDDGLARFDASGRGALNQAYRAEE